MTATADYVQPCNAGLQSEPRAAGRRIAKLLDALGTHVNRYICQGDIEHDVWKFRMELITKLKSSGWRVSVKTNDRYSVLPPKEGGRNGKGK